VLRSVLGYGLKFSKPTRRSTIKAREDREEARVIKRVRPLVVERDGYCRLAWAAALPTCPLDACSGPSEWAHLEGHRRFETVNLPPEERHSTTWTAMLCDHHHDLYDAHEFDIKQKTERGADGPLRLVIGNRTYEEID
jgi:hypothetical protein